MYVTTLLTRSCFYTTIILLTSSWGFVNVLLRITDLFNQGFSLSSIDDFYHGLRQRPWNKRETHIFRYGYYYALSCTLVNITTVFGTYSPILVPLCSGFLFMKGLCDGATFICVYGKDLTGNGKLFECAVRRIFAGIILGHLLLFNQSYWESQVVPMVINSIFVVLFTCVFIFLKLFGVADFKNISNMFKQESYSTPSLNDQADWIYKTIHPFIRNTPYAEDYMSIFNSLQVKPSELKDQTLHNQQKQRFESIMRKKLHLQPVPVHTNTGIHTGGGGVGSSAIGSELLAHHTIVQPSIKSVARQPASGRRFFEVPNEPALKTGKSVDQSLVLPADLEISPRFRMSVERGGRGEMEGFGVLKIRKNLRNSEVEQPVEEGCSEDGDGGSSRLLMSQRKATKEEEGIDANHEWKEMLRLKIHSRETLSEISDVTPLGNNRTFKKSSLRLEKNSELPGIEEESFAEMPSIAWEISPEMQGREIPKENPEPVFSSRSISIG